MFDPLVVKLGALPDPPDERDFLLSALVPGVDTVQVPEVWRPGRRPIRYQRQLGSCVAFAGAGQNEVIHLDDTANAEDLSEQFAYGEAKKRDNWPGEGTYPRTMMDVMLKVGICEESFMPYEGRYPPTRPPKDGAYENALKYRIGSYAAVARDFTSLQQARFLNGPLMIAVDVYDSFVSTPGNGVVPMPSGGMVGGHAMCFDGGWDIRNGKVCLEVRNSWSDQWGDQGYAWISEDVWDAIRQGAWAVVDETLIPRHWTDWPDDGLTEADVVWKAGVFKGYPDGTFQPWQNVTRRQVALVAERLSLPIDVQVYDEDYSLASRGWVHDTIPGLSWLEERWEEPLTRFQLVMLVGRLLQGRQASV